MVQRIWYLSRCSLFERLSPTDLRRLEHHALLRRFKKGNAVFIPRDAADHVCLVVDGRIRLCSSTPDGKRAILGFVEPGEIFGELALIDPASREERAEAEKDSTIVLVSGAVVREIMNESTELALGVTKLIGLGRTRIERRLKSLLFRSNRDRLINLLVELAERYGKRIGNEIHLEIKLSHQDIASIIGSTRESVTNTLGELQCDGLLRIARQKLVISDMKALARIADVQEPHIATSSQIELQTSRFCRPDVAPAAVSEENF
jgi:CRP/FNR family transcriptional regulator, cyclic AMP receptor protein